MQDNGLVQNESRDRALNAFADAARSLIEPPDDFLQSPVEPGSLHDELRLVEMSEIGRRVGPHRIVELIGAGGMGAVYRAVRDDGAFEQEVAVKLVRPGLFSAEVLRRFERERAALAVLDHPWIARLLDGGALAGGRPYLVMEYVRGEPIDRNCAARRADLEMRIRLMHRVAIAVHAAHQHLIVHRDLKPANMLVTDEGEPKLLDFGVAKWLDDAGTRLGGTADATLPWLRIITPQYASPEQLHGDAITTASDIYSLGVVLYELVTGHRPYALGERGRAEVERIVGAQAPLPPSRVVDRNDASTRLPLFDPSIFSSGWARRLRGDVDAIVLKSIAKDPRDRYASAREFAEDLERWLDDRSVRARREGAVERSRRFIRRHRVAVGAALLVLVTIVAGATGTTIGFMREAASNQAALLAARRAERQAERADQEARIAHRSSEFLKSILRAADPALGLGPGVSLRALLQDAHERLKREFADEPALRAELLTTVAATCQSIGMLEEAEEAYRAVVEILADLHGRQSVECGQALVDLGLNQKERCDVLNAHRSLDEAVYRLARVPGAERNHASAVIALAELLSDAQWFEPALVMFDSALELTKKSYGEAHAEYARSLNGLGVTYHRLGRFDDAELTYMLSLRTYKALGLAEDSISIPVRANIAKLRYDQGRLDEALARYEEVIPTIPRGSFSVVTVQRCYAELLIDLGRVEEADVILRDCLAMVHSALLADDCRVQSIERAFASIDAKRESVK